MSKKEYIRKCGYSKCGQNFVAHRKDRRFCCHTHGNLAWQAEHPERFQTIVDKSLEGRRQRTQQKRAEATALENSFRVRLDGLPVIDIVRQMDAAGVRSGSIQRVADISRQRLQALRRRISREATSHPLSSEAEHAERSQHD